MSIISRFEFICNASPNAMGGLFLGGMLVCVTMLPAAAQQPQEIDPNDADPERRRILQLIESLETIGDDQRLEGAETFDTAWALAVQGEDPVLNVNSEFGSPLKPGEHEVNAGARSRLQAVYEKSSDRFRAAYEDYAANKARVAIEEAVEQGNTSDLVSVILRYQFTRAGQQALENVIRLRLSRGEILQAALQFGRLMRLRNDVSAESTVQLATLWWRAGLHEEAVDYLAAAVQQYPGKQITLFGVTLAVPDTTEKLEQWLQKNSGSEASTVELLAWQQSGGNYRRTGLQTTGPAALDMTWAISSYRSEECVDCPNGDEINRLLLPLVPRMEEQFRRRLASNDTISPVAQPIVVGDLLIFRGVAKIRAVNRKTGELAWETALIDRGLNSAIEAWSRDEETDPMALERVQFGIEGDLFSNAVRDNVSGQLTSNGRLVFAVEPATTPSLSPDRDVRRFPFQKPANYLRAYDVETGQLKGQAGGSIGISSGGPVNPLAGMFFLGAPLVMGERIYVIAENDQGIFLLQLRATPLFDAEGQVDMRSVRSQLLSTPRFSLRMHPVRRYAGVIPSFSGGLLICNTVDEQVIAISADDHSLRWVYRYGGNVSEPEINQGFAVLGNAYSPIQSDRVDLAARWTDALPRIVANRIFVTPRDCDRLICLDLQTGREIWTKARGSMRSIAAVTNDRLVLTGPRSIECLEAATGAPVWKVDIEDGRISGRAVFDGNILQVPTSLPAIVSFDLATGRKLLTQPVSGGIPGNLLSIDGRLSSQSLTQVTSFRVAEDQQDSPLTKAQGYLLAGDVDQAEKAMNLVRSDENSSPKQRRRADDLMIETLLEVLRTDFSGNASRIPELRALIENNVTPDEQLVTLVDSMIGMTLGDAAVIPEIWTQANSSRKRLAQLQSLMTQNSLADSNRVPDQIAKEMFALLKTASQSEDSRIQNGDVSVSNQRALIAAVRDALLSQTAEQRLAVSSLMGPMLTSQIRDSKTPAEAAWWWQAALLSGFYEGAASLALEDSVTLPARLNSPLRHMALLEAIEQGTEEQSAKYAQSMIEQWVANGKEVNAGNLVGRSLRKANFERNNSIKDITSTASVSSDFAFSSSVASLEWLQKWSEDPRLGATALKTPFNGVPEVTESPARIGQGPAKLKSDSPDLTIPLFGGGGAFANWAFVERANSNKIYAYDADGRFRWSFDPGSMMTVSSRGLGAFYNSLSARYAVAYGELLAFKLDHMLFMLDCSSVAPQGSPQQLWELNVSTAVEAPTEAQQSIPAWQRTTQYVMQPGGLYPVGPPTSFGVPVYNGRRLAVFDILTGQREWEVDGLPGDCSLTVNGDALLLISKAAGQVEARQLIDGKVASVSALPLWWNDAEENSNASARTFELAEDEDERWRLSISDGRSLLVRRNLKSVALESYDLQKGVTEWSIALPADSAVSNTCDGHVAILSDGVDLQIIDTKGGSRVCQMKVPEASDNMYLYLRSSGGQWLVITDVFDQDYDDQNPVSESVHVGGQIYGVNQATGQLTWTKSIDHEWLRMSVPSQSPTPPNFPVLVLLKRPYPPRGVNGVAAPAYYQGKILDVRTGQVLYEDKNLGLNLAYYCLFPDEAANEIKVGFNIRDITFRYEQPR